MGQQAVPCYGPQLAAQQWFLARLTRFRWACLWAEHEPQRWTHKEIDPINEQPIFRLLATKRIDGKRDSLAWDNGFWHATVNDLRHGFCQCP